MEQQFSKLMVIGSSPVRCELALELMSYPENLLVYILVFPIFGILLLLFLPSENAKLLKSIALNFSGFSFLMSLLLWGFFHKPVGSFQFVVKFFWFSSLNLNFTLGIDGISLFFVLLTTLLIPLCLLSAIL
jgi:NADH-quinone oxidoreductase subunit M